MKEQASFDFPETEVKSPVSLPKREMTPESAFRAGWSAGRRHNVLLPENIDAAWQEFKRQYE